MDRLTAMQTFVRVVEAGSFSAVAREMGATQSAVSKQVAALERALGARLLGRTTRSLGLTEEGERYFEQARRLVAEVAEAESALRAGQQRLSGWLRVAASVWGEPSAYVRLWRATAKYVAIQPVARHQPRAYITHRRQPLQPQMQAQRQFFFWYIPANRPRLREVLERLKLGKVARLLLSRTAYKEGRTYAPSVERDENPEMMERTIEQRKSHSRCSTP